MITIDTRIGSANLVKFFTPGNFELATLDSADFAFDGNDRDGSLCMIGIERKTVTEFLTDYARFVNNQLEALVNSYNYAYVLIEGAIRPALKTKHCELWQRGKWDVAPGCNVPYATFLGRITSLQNLFGVTVVRTLSEFETAIYVESLHVWYRKGWDEHKSHQTFYIPPPPYALPRRPTVLEKRLSCLPKIGWDKVMKISSRFKSERAILDATVEDWMTFDGIGRTIAERIVATLRKEYK
jgi:ERCC4-type nuclease